LGRGDVLFLYKKPFWFCINYAMIAHCFGSNSASYFVALCYVAMTKCVIAFETNASQVF